MFYPGVLAIDFSLFYEKFMATAYQLYFSLIKFKKNNLFLDFSLESSAGHYYHP